ncbi:hypothetical protein K438DRAFT_2013871 [Mycena galopus ATCC 62051]|nr:hypothetical protein K438DRAFT_2013871 [Mycena galopus ATCC 62051]
MRSLPDLPTELLMEVIRYYSNLYLFPVIPTGYSRALPLKTTLAEDAPHGWRLRVRGKRCPPSALRHMPSSTARVPSPAVGAGARERMFHEAIHLHTLERRMVDIHRTPHVVPHIRSLTVTRAACNTGHQRPMAEVIRVLELLLNLEDFTIVQVPCGKIDPILTNTTCSGKLFPSVWRLALDDHLARMMACFPHVQTLNVLWSKCASNDTNCAFYYRDYADTDGKGLFEGNLITRGLAVHYGFIRSPIMPKSVAPVLSSLSSGTTPCYRRILNS